MKNPKVSLFQNYREKLPVRQVRLLDWVCSDLYKGAAEHIRSIFNKNEQRELKAQLPCITPSGIFSYCSDKNLDCHSGFICIDIDGGKDNPDITDFERLKSEVISGIEYVAYCGLSISGNGVFCLIPIESPQFHKEHFYALEEYFREKGIVIDSSCKNVSRLRGASYDANPFLNPDAVTFAGKIEQAVKKIKKHIPSENALKGLVTKGVQSIPLIMAPILQMIEVNQIDITGNRHRWFGIGCALANEYGEEGRDIFHAVSRFYKNDGYYYTKEETDELYDSCLKNCHKYNYSIGTFYYWCKEYGML
ncbi:BT4734/BF3469 family protein [Bacteroides gallinarum]|uniref:BT4734/BF3469 family protein n=1 Tax=Bacteroides gallinarum TaxID=376806 RepID=UPI000364F9C7|nr:BT4734/BF3469 family protein [Bacteroides gallinarum]